MLTWKWISLSLSGCLLVTSLSRSAAVISPQKKGSELFTESGFYISFSVYPRRKTKGLAAHCEECAALSKATHRVNCANLYLKATAVLQGEISGSALEISCYLQAV